MEDLELKNLWQSYDKKLAEAQVLNAQSWALNLRCFENIQQQKARSKLTSLAGFKIRAIVLGIVWILFLALLVWGNQFRNPYFGISVSMIALFSAYAVFAYTKDIISIKQLNYSGSIINTQKKLASLKAATFQSTRVLWLQMPFHTTWWWHKQWIMESGSSFWLIAVPVTLLFTLLAIFLYKNITIDNMHKKWVRALMMAGPEYKNLVHSMEFLDEIEDFKKELI